MNSRIASPHQWLTNHLGDCAARATISTNAHRRPTVSSPENGQAVNMKFARDRRVACVGATDEVVVRKRSASLASVGDAAGGVDAPGPAEKRRVVKSGVLVSKDLRCTLYADDELAESSPLSVTSLAQTLRLRLGAELDVLRGMVRQTFADVVDASLADACQPPDGAAVEASFLVSSTVRVDVFVDADGSGRELVLTWDAAPLGDVVADAIVCVALHCQASPAALASAGPCCVPRPDDLDDSDDGAAAARVADFLRRALVDQFGDEHVTDLKDKASERGGDVDERGDAARAADAAATDARDAAPRDEPREEPQAKDARPRAESNASALSESYADVATFDVVLDDAKATCVLKSDGPNFRLDVASDDDALRRRLRKLLERALDAQNPIKTAVPTMFA